MGDASNNSKLQYLKRYKSDNDDISKKKRKRKRAENPHALSGITVIDLEVQVHKLTCRVREDDPYRDNGPTVSEVVDDNIPKGMQDSTKWKAVPVVGSDSDTAGFGSRNTHLRIAIKQESPDPDASPLRRSHRVSQGSVLRTEKASSRSAVGNKDMLLVDDDLSPSRRGGASSKISHTSPHHFRDRKDDFDLSPVRQPGVLPSHLRDNTEDGDSSSRGKTSVRLPERRRHGPFSAAYRPSGEMRRPENAEEDLSPVRRKDCLHREESRSTRDFSPVRRSGHQQRRRQSSSDPDVSPLRRANSETSRKPAAERQTLSGMSAGLQNAQTLRKESEKKRQAEEELFRRMDKDISGREAQTVYRDRKTGKRRNMDAEAKEEAEKAARKAAHEEKFRKWGKGIAQHTHQGKAAEDAVHEISKPLARHIDDCDRDALLKAQEREGDPMLEYLRAKKSKKSSNIQENPKYNGPAPAPNRFGILPGYRWDGVDRSSGFEKERYKRLSNRVATADEAYKWSTEDM